MPVYVKFDNSAQQTEICKKLLISSFLSDIPIISIMKVNTKLEIRLFSGKEMT